MLSKSYSYILSFITSITSVYSSSITISTIDYGLENILIGIFCILAFLFWMFVYSFAGKFEFDKKNLVKSITNIGVKFVSWVWFVSLFFLSLSIILISGGENFLDDKLEIIWSLGILTIIIFGMLGFMNGIKFFNKISGVENFMKEFLYEIKTGGKR